MPVGFNTEFNIPMGLTGLPFGKNAVDTTTVPDPVRGKPGSKQIQVELDTSSLFGTQGKIDPSKNLIQYDNNGWNIFGQDMFGDQNNILTQVHKENYTEANLKLGQIEKLIAKYKSNPTDLAFQKQLTKIVNSTNIYNFTFVDKFGKLLKDNFPSNQALNLIKQCNTNIQDNLVRQYVRNGGSFDQQMLGNLFSFSSKNGIAELQKSLSSGQPEKINIVRSDGKLYLTVKVNGKEEKAELNSSNFFIFKSLYRDAMQGKYNKEVINVFNLLGFDAKNNNFTINGVTLQSNINLSTLLQIPNALDSAGMNTGTVVLNKVLIGMNPQQLSKVVLAVGDATNNIKSGSLYRLASFIKNPRFEMFGYVQNNGNTSSSHASFVAAMNTFKNDMRICITQHSLSVETINEFRELCKSNYDKMNIDPVIKQAYQEAIDNPPRGPDDINAQALSSEKAVQSHIARYNDELKELGITFSADNRTFSEKVDLLWQNLSLPFRSTPKEINYARFYMDYQSTKQPYLDNKIGGYEENTTAILNTYNNINVTSFIQKLSTQMNVRGMDKLAENNIANHQVLTFCYTDCNTKISQPVYLVGGTTNDGKYFFVDPLTGREYSGTWLSDIRQDFLEHGQFQPFSRLSYLSSPGKLEDNIIPMTTRKRVVGGLETIGLATGTIATIAFLSLNPTGPVAGPAGTVAILSFGASVSTRTADTAERFVSGEHISGREVFDLVSQWMLLGGGGVAKLLNGQQLTSKTVTMLYTMAKSSENIGLAMMSIGISETAYRGITEKDPAAALAILQATMMIAVAVRVKTIAQNRNLTEAEKKHYEIGKNETSQNFIAKMTRRANIIMKRMKKASEPNYSGNNSLNGNNKFSESPEIQKLLNKFMIKSETNLISYLSSKQNAPLVTKIIKELSGIKAVSDVEMKTLVNNSMPLMTKFFSGCISKLNRLSEMKALLMKQNPELFSISDKPTPSQKISLAKYKAEIDRGVTVLRGKLQSITTNSGYEKFSAVNVRAKGPAGILDKIGRMRNGNAGRDVRPDYTLGDMPDALGGRITVESISDLPTIMKGLETTFGRDNVIEVDNFYLSSTKSQRPYRVITYTVLMDNGNGVKIPCEIQVTTLKASVMADLDHDGIYKGIVSTTEAEKQLIKNLHNAAVASEIQEVQRGINTTK